MAKLYNITLTAANPPTIGYTVYYNSVNAATIATIGLTGGPATGLTKAQLVSPGLKVSVPDAATSVVLYNVECTSSTSFTVPTYVTIVASAANVSTTSLTLNWTTTPGGVATSYLIFRDGVLIATLGNVATYAVTGLTLGTTYNFAVQAKNVNGNVIGTSNAVIVTTAAGSSVIFSDEYETDIIGITSYSGTVTVVGNAATFKAYAYNGGDPFGTVNTSATIDGTGMSAYNPFGDGTVLSTNSKTLTAGTYNYSLQVNISTTPPNFDIFGGIQWTQ